MGHDSSSLPRELVKFLNKADELYIEAYQTRKYGLLVDRFSLDCMRGIESDVIHNGELRYFGDRHFRTTTWELLSDSDNMCVVRKKCLYKIIHINLFRTMKASNDYTEDWSITKVGKYKYTVNMIGKEVLIG